MNARISELLTILMNTQNELAELRSKCLHPGYEVGWWSWRVGAIDASRICTECGLSIPGITEEERTKLGPFHKSAESGVNVGDGLTFYTSTSAAT